MKLRHVLGGSDSIIHDKEFPMNSVVLTLDNGIDFICTDFRKSYRKPLKVYCYLSTEKRWVITFINRELKETMWKYYCKHIQKKRSKINYEEYMKHDRKHKRKSGGNLVSKYAITDYECAKEPLHDFRRVYI